MRRTFLFRQWVMVGLVIWLTGLAGQIMAQTPTEIGTTFTYEGYLTDENGDSLEGVYDFEFKLYDAPSGGSQLGAAVVSDNVTVLEGRFSVPLDFGRHIFTGDARYLEMGLRPGKRFDAFTPLPGRPKLPVAAYALALPNLWTEPNPVSPNLIGGYRENNITRGVLGATIAGGGAPGQTNRITDDYGVVGGGHNNQAGDNTGLTSDTPFATVGGGLANNALNSYATVDGGWLNHADGSFSSVGGGSQNNAADIYTTVGGGLDNTADAPGATVGGGWLNNATNIYAAIGGGYNNKANEIYTAVGGGSYNMSAGSWATVGGGYNNYAGGGYSIIPGGQDNRAGGDFSFAAGQQAQANSPGCFVWADASKTDLPCNTPNRFMVRATGGVYFFTSVDQNSGAALPPGSGSWATWSDRQAKANFAPVNGQDVLTRLSGLSIHTWNYKTQDPAIRHIGPTAQDFQTAFGLGEDDRHISAVDADGVALAAIQELHQLTQDQAAQLAAQQAQIAALEARLAALETLLKNHIEHK